MLMNIICALCFYPILPLVYFLLKQGATKDKYIFGVTLSKELRESEEIQEYITQYKKSMRIIFWAVMIPPAFSFFIPYESVGFTIWMIFLFAGMGAFAIPYIEANKKTMIFKYKNVDVDQAGKRGAKVYVDLKSIVTPKIKMGYMNIPTGISIALAVWSLTVSKAYTEESARRISSMATIVIIFAVATVVIHVLTILMMKQRNEVICSDSEININYSRATKKAMHNFMFWIANINTLATFAICIALVTDTSVGNVVLWAGIAETILVCVFSVRYVRIKQKIDKAYMPYVEENILEDDDIYWKYGLIYNNPKDKRSLVSKRVGVGTTVNMAKLAGKITVAITAGSIAMCLFLGVYMMLEEFTPIHLDYDNGVISCMHTKEKYTIHAEDVETMELITEMPDLTKDYGTAMDKLYKGQFTDQDTHEICKVFLNPKNKYIIKIETKETIYYIGGYDDEDTLKTYNAMEYYCSYLNP